MLTSLLVPLDRSPESEEALPYAATIALASNAALTLVTVRELPSATELPLPVPITNRQDDQKYLDVMRQRVSAYGVTQVECTVSDGEPSASICAEAERVGAGLIVMTSHFHTGLARAWAGSVADRVVRGSTVPVLMVRAVHRAPDAPLPKTAFQRILVPLDGSASASSILPAVRALATSGNTEVLLLRVVRPPTPATPLFTLTATIPQMGMAISQVDFEAVDHATKHLVGEATEELNNTAAELRAEGLSRVSWFVEIEDKIDDTIIAFASAHAVDLIALSTHGRGASRLFVGSVADALLRESALPILLHRPSPTLVDQPHLTRAQVECQLPGLVA